MDKIGLFIAIPWLAGWLIVGVGVVILTQKELGILSSMSRFVLCFFFWPFVLLMAIYFKIRGET